MFITDLRPQHRLLFNKFSVLPGHLLVLSRDFEPQEGPLTEEDLGAVSERPLRSVGPGFKVRGCALGWVSF